MTEQQRPPTPELIFETLNAYQRTAALRTAIELDLFTAIGEGATTAAAIAARCSAAERGIRILCDTLVAIGLLAKQDNFYKLTPDSAVFLDRRSPKYVGSSIGFRLLPEMVQPFDNLIEAVRHGGTVISKEGIAKPDDPVWVEFARSMGPMQSMPSEGLARHWRGVKEEKGKVLDVAASHGKFGIAFARHNPEAQIYLLDWPTVLEVARENARQAGVESRMHFLGGDAMEMDLGEGYDLILLANFLQILAPERIHALLPRLHRALAANGRVITLGFIPDENRVTPPNVATFAIIMLATTPGGDAYTFADYERMFRAAGFSSSEFIAIPNSPQRIVVSHK
ncbi:MAG TPA: class I SAM-dependent methyltransferase [Candidatus Acidoferrum sp.]|nr:class I SAM-dependent methyltransferase [Candidatus Acidoferrum sp.]